MEYQLLSSEDRNSILTERIRQYESQHFNATIDEQTALAVDDEEGAEQAQKRQKTIEGAISALRAGLSTPTE